MNMDSDGRTNDDVAKGGINPQHSQDEQIVPANAPLPGSYTSVPVTTDEEIDDGGWLCI